MNASEANKIFEVVLCDRILSAGGPLDKEERKVMMKAVKMYKNKLVKEKKDDSSRTDI